MKRLLTALMIAACTLGPGGPAPTPAHAEAAQTTPRPRDRMEMLELLRAEILRTHPDWTVTIDRKDVSLRYTKPDKASGVVNPDNIFARLRGIAAGAERRRELEHFVATILDAKRDARLKAVSASDLMPVLRPDAMLAYVKTQLGAKAGKDKLPLVTPLPGPLDVYYVVDLPDSVAYATPETLKTAGVSRAQLPAIARGNLRQRSAGKLRVSGRDGLWIVRFDGYYETSLLLLRTSDPFGLRMKTPVAMALSRDVLLVADAAVPGAEARMEKIARDNRGKLSYPLSTELWRWKIDGHWVPSGN